MQYLLIRLLDTSFKFGLFIDCVKTEITNINCSQYGWTCRKETVNVAEHIKYLGTIVSKTGSVTEEYKEHVNIKRLEVRRLESIKCSRKISINTKIKVYKTMVKFILIYRREGWYKQ